MTQAFNLSQLANNLDSAGRLDATDGLINAVPIANGGTGASSASAARTNLSVPSTTGGGATGTWDIAISGNAATATNATNATNLTGSGAAVANLGFTPVQQGGGSGQDTNKVYIGWSAAGLKCQVDASDQGSFWIGQQTAFNGGSSGYQKLPSGLYIQWGYFDMTGSATAVSFPTPFPSLCVNVQITIANAAGSVSAPGVADVTRFGFNCLRDPAVPNTPIFFMALGA